MSLPVASEAVFVIVSGSDGRRSLVIPEAWKQLAMSHPGGMRLCPASVYNFVILAQNVLKKLDPKPS